MKKILLDTDIGGDIDDAICLAYLLKEPQCNLLGITTVSGESDIRAAVADALCKTANKDIPIVAGFDTPLQTIPVYPTPEGATGLSNWKHDSYKKSNAPAFMYQIIKDHPHEIILIGIGNMTNIATLFNNYPDASSLLKGLYVMNGYFGKAALPNPWYNWNSWADPLASKIVFNSKVKSHKAFPLEVTSQLTIDASKADELLDRTSNLTKAVLDFGNAWLENYKQLTLHDPLVAITIFHPEICQFEKGFVTVETNEEQKMGDTRFILHNKGNVDIARKVDKEAFYRILFSTLTYVP